MEVNLREIPHLLVGSLMEVHKELGPGLVREAYRIALAHELRMREILFKEQVPVSVTYKGVRLDSALKIDFVVEEVVAVHVYSEDGLDQEHKEKMRNHLQLSGLETGFLVNFNCSDLRKGGLKRLIVSDHEPDMPWRRVEEEDEGLRRVHEL